jgi:DNA primase
MQKLPDNSRSNSISNPQNAGWNIGADDKDALKDLIARANSANLLEIFTRYDIPIDGYGGKKCCCPLPNHDDNSPSFYYYTDTNSFFCFGCKMAGRAVRFVSLMENVSNEEAADKIIQGYETNPNVVSNNGREHREKQKLMLEFSSIIRSFLQSNRDDPQALEYADRIAKGFDTITGRNEIQNDGIRKVIDKLKDKLGEYKVCQ